MLAIELLAGCLIQKSAISGKSQKLPQSTTSTFIDVFMEMNPKARGAYCTSRFLMKELKRHLFLA